jgi:hypothetical protein
VKSKDIENVLSLIHEVEESNTEIIFQTEIVYPEDSVRITEEFEELDKFIFEKNIISGISKITIKLKKKASYPTSGTGKPKNHDTEKPKIS